MVNTSRPDLINLLTDFQKNYKGSEIVISTIHNSNSLSVKMMRGKKIEKHYSLNLFAYSGHETALELEMKKPKALSGGIEKWQIIDSEKRNNMDYQAKQRNLIRFKRFIIQYKESK